MALTVLYAFTASYAPHIYQKTLFRCRDVFIYQIYSNKPIRKTVMSRLLSLILLSLLAMPSGADVLQLKADSPKDYVVVKGDTLWDISAKFLTSPWRWPELWQVNQQISDPHWIYPGDKISLIYINGKPQLVVNRAKPQLVMTRHGRKVRRAPPIPTIELSKIRHYLTQQQIISATKLSELPLLIGSENDSLFYKNNDIIFVNSSLPVGAQVGIYRRGKQYRSPISDQPLGLEMVLVAKAHVTVDADTSRLKLREVLEQVNNGHFVMALPQQPFPEVFMLQAAAVDIKSVVIDSAKYFRESGINDVVIIDGGHKQGIKQGHVFAIYQPGKVQYINSEGMVKDPLTYRTIDKVKSYFVSAYDQKLPNVYRGRLMVFKSFEYLSYALITDVSKPIRSGDELIKP